MVERIQVVPKPDGSAPCEDRLSRTWPPPVFTRQIIVPLYLLIITTRESILVMNTLLDEKFLLALVF